MAKSGRPLHLVDPQKSFSCALGSAIRDRRCERKLTLQQLAARVGYSAQHLSEVERGRAPASMAFVAALDHALDAQGELLELVPAAQWERIVDRESRAVALRLGTGRRNEDDDVKRREFLGLGLAGLLPIDAARDAFGPDVEEWERAAHAYQIEAATAPAAELLPALAADLKELRGLLDGPLTGSQRQRLTGVLAQLSALTARAIDDPHVSRRWWRRARQTAAAAGDSHLRAFVLSDQAMAALYGGGGYTVHQVVVVADEALATTNAPCVGRMNALAARAQALAILGREDEARAAVVDSCEAFERLPRDVTRERVSRLGWPEHKVRHTESYVGMHIGGGEDARDRALALYPAGAWRGPTQIRLHRAASLIRSGDITEGGREAERALAPLSDAQRSDRFVRTIALHAMRPGDRREG